LFGLKLQYYPASLEEENSLSNSMQYTGIFIPFKISFLFLSFNISSLFLSSTYNQCKGYPNGEKPE
jgi:hypothetical protein